jgi:hypothetical protein
MMREEGLGPENWYLRGQFVSRIPQKTVPSAYPEEGFPYRWDFNDGTLCGINGPGQMENVRVEGGVLKAATSGKDAFLSWGDFDGKGVPLHFGFPTRDGYTMPTLAAVTVRLRQTPADGLAVWQAAAARARCSRARRWCRARLGKMWSWCSRMSPRPPTPVSS